MTDLFGGLFKGLNVLITGHTGFKGSWLSMILDRLGAHVSGYALSPPTNPSLFYHADVDRTINSFQGDVRNYQKLSDVIQEVRPELIFHLAAQPLVRYSFQEPVETFSTNVMGTVNLLEACRHQSSVRAVINITTDKCYENREWLWGYREQDQLGGYDPYSNSKACSELVTASYRNSFFNPADFDRHGVVLASARAGNVIGGGDFAEDRLVPDFIRSMMKGELLYIRNPEATRPWQHVLEPLTGYLRLAEQTLRQGPDFGEAWNFGPEEEDAKNVAWMAERLCNYWGDDASFRIAGGRHVHETTYLKLDCSKSKNKLAWHPKWNIETTLKTIVDWNKEWIKGADPGRLCIERIEKYFAA